MTNPLAKLLLLVALVMVLPLLLLAFAGESFSSFVDSVKTDPPSPAVCFVAVVGMLATDVFLPVPSGPISTLAGSQLGIFAGTVASTTGMTIGGLIAFALARRWGRPVARRLASDQELRSCEQIADTFGISLILVTRPLPMLAEACVLVMGTLQMHWRVFLPVLVGSNVLISVVYATLGHLARDQDWLVMAVCSSVAVPVLLVATFQRVARNHQR